VSSSVAAVLDGDLKPFDRDGIRRTGWLSVLKALGEDLLCFLRNLAWDLSRGLAAWSGAPVPRLPRVLPACTALRLQTEVASSTLELESSSFQYFQFAARRPESSVGSAVLSPAVASVADPRRGVPGDAEASRGPAIARRPARSAAPLPPCLPPRFPPDMVMKQVPCAGALCEREKRQSVQKSRVRAGGGGSGGGGGISPQPVGRHLSQGPAGCRHCMTAQLPRQKKAAAGSPCPRYPVGPTGPHVRAVRGMEEPGASGLIGMRGTGGAAAAGRWGRRPGRQPQKTKISKARSPSPRPSIGSRGRGPPRSPSPWGKALP